MFVSLQTTAKLGTYLNRFKDNEKLLPAILTTSQALTTKAKHTSSDCNLSELGPESFLNSDSQLQYLIYLCVQEYWIDLKAEVLALRESHERIDVPTSSINVASVMYREKNIKPLFLLSPQQLASIPEYVRYSRRVTLILN